MMSNEGGVEKIDLNKVDWRGSREFFESLGETLDRLDDKDESYDFTWVGKRKSIIEAGAPINKTLRPDVDASKNWDTTENLFIEGDNLDALKLLQESYLGKVKMIYIDPPYNTGKDFVYHDNFKATTEQYDEDTEYHDEDGNIQFKKNEKSNGRYHSDWLSMMYPRLKLARNLLSEDGVIFMSIGDDELANLIKLGDDIFGESNALPVSVRVTKKSSNNGTTFSPCTDYVVAFAKNIDTVPEYSVPLTEEQVKSYNKEDEKGKYKEIGLYQAALKHGGSRYAITAPDGSQIITPGTAPWRWNEAKLKEGLSQDLIVFKQTPSSPLIDPDTGERASWNIYTKLYLSDRQDAGLHPKTFLEDFQNAQASNELRKLDIPFDFAKPTTLTKYLAGLQSDGDSIVLDFFSGSATTAHAVMQLNAEDGGNRKWIMVQLPEETDEKSEAFKAGYKTIPEISRERIRRAGDKIAGEHPDAKVDYGFRALRIDDTNHKDVYRPAADYQQNMLDELVDNVKEDRSDLDLLYGVLTATAWELNKPLETVELDGATVYKYDYFGEVSGLVACFADEISEEAIKQIAQLKPLTAVFKEGSFPNSQAKVNLAEHFRIISSDTKVKVI
jgi:adenine-specific DNA-methyltransferase